MRETFIPPTDETPSRKKNRHAISAKWPLALLSDTAAVAFVASLLWLGSGGVSVFQGSPLVMAVAFAGGAALAATTLIAVSRLEVEPRGEMLRAMATILLLGIAYAVVSRVVVEYFLAWSLLFAGVFFAARESALILAGAFRGRGTRAAGWRAASAASGMAVVALLQDVWWGEGLLADLVVFVLLMVVAAIVTYAISGALRTPIRANEAAPRTEGQETR